jgi:hypothetical protein
MLREFININHELVNSHSILFQRVQVIITKTFLKYVTILMTMY